MASTETPRSGEDLIEELDIIDGEIHTPEWGPDLVEYIDDEDIQADERGGYLYSIEDYMPFGADGWDRSAGGRIDVGRTEVERAEDFDEKREMFGMDRALFSPGLGFQLYMIPRTDRQPVYMRAMNEYTRDRFARGDGTYYGKICIYPDHPEASAEEIERLGDRDEFVAVFTNSMMDYGFGHDRYEPILAAAEKHDLPIVFHGDSTKQPYFPVGFLKSRSFFEHHTLAHPLAHARHAASIISYEIPERYDVDFCFLEAGQSWVQMLMNRIDREYMERPSDAPGLTRLPSEYIREFYFGTQPLEEPRKPEHLGQIIEMNGLDDQIVFTSDWPHMDFDSPVAVANHAGLSEEQKVKILQDNPADLFF